MQAKNYLLLPFIVIKLFLGSNKIRISCIRDRLSGMILTFLADTLLNVFLAIAVDNLASARELTAAEEAQKEEEEKVKFLLSILFIFMIATLQIKFDIFT